ncbi:YafY family transcriptional regulator [Hymenobacter lutimineralis]|uniref:YafY family transcriptional regulator n=1 Tax=Hymenobacter lutimineralis TaxID=2606448 RepID=A0A5D6VFJ2_9BACT|nr:YafY family protein [Hymenobacter lutimineralis]TYZ13559.1 YafY family transcriptional regulator [Hymenobacter lutimineralis]
MYRFDRVTAILIQLQAKRKVSGAALAEQFGVSLRTIYRDLRTLAEAGVPLLGEPGIGYSLAEGYRLPPVMFTRGEATALLTAEKLAGRLTDAPTAQLSSAAMDKVRAVLRRPDRDHLDRLAPHIQVLGPRQAGQPPAYQQLVAAIAMHHVVSLRYQTAENQTPTTRDIEPISLFLTRHWHVVAYCRLRQTIRNFRLDRILGLELKAESFVARPDLLQQHWAAEASRRPRERVVLRFQPAALLPALVQHLHDTKHQYGWAHEQRLPDGQLEMTLFIGELPYLATWLLPYAGALTIVEPRALSAPLRALAQRAHDFFCQPE